MFSTSRVLSTALCGALLACLVPAVAVEPAGAVVGNSSLWLYRSANGANNASRAIVANGVYTAKGASTLPVGWTGLAVSSDTVIFYNKNSGAAVTGTFVNGVYTKKHNYMLAKGYDVVVAGCDSVVLFDRDSRQAVTGVLDDGAYKKVNQFSFSVANLVAVSCDTMLLYAPDGFTATWAIHWGRISASKSYSFSTGWTTITATNDSVIIHNKNTGSTAYGRLTDGEFTQTGTATFSAWTGIAGTSSSVTLYNRDTRVLVTARLVDGVFTQKQTLNNQPAWDIITGAK